MDNTLIKSVRQRFEGMKQDRQKWEKLWKDIRDYTLPDLGIFDGEDSLVGSERYRRLVDAETTHAADVLAAGLLGGVSSPSRPWLRLSTLEPELDKLSEVKAWLDEVQKNMLMLFAKADVYNQLHQSYLELPTFGQSCVLCRKHPERVISLQNLTIGQYWIAEDDFGRVDTLYRRMSLTAKQMVQQWGLEAVSNDVRNAYRGNPWQKFNVIHAIEPRWERDYTKSDSVNMPFSSVYFEESGTENALSVSGFRDFPAMCPRWMTLGNSQYGRGPGVKALSASKSLQQLQTRLATLVDYLTDPPWLYPDSLVDMLDQLRPGGRIPASPSEAEIVRPAIQLTANPQYLIELINARKQEIQRMFHVDVFQMLASTTTQTDRTATEVAALEQEKVLMLGPVLERLHTELLDPLVTTTFSYMVEANRVPPAPEALQGREISVEYISVLAERQKNSSVEGILRTTQQIGMLAQLDPSVIDKLDKDAVVDTLADMNGVPPSLIVSGQRVALIRNARAQQQQQMEQQQMTAQAVQNMRNMVPVAESQGMQQALNDGLENIAGG